MSGLYEEENVKASLPVVHKENEDVSRAKVSAYSAQVEW